MISKRAHYALHGVVYLAHKHSEPPVSFTEILEYLHTYSKNLSFSFGYISKIFQELSRAGIVNAIVGRNGGYSLARHPSELPISDVIAALDGYRVEKCCLLSVSGGCGNQESCGVHQAIKGAEKQFYDFLKKETAESLARKAFRDQGHTGAKTSRSRAKPRRKKASRKPRLKKA